MSAARMHRIMFVLFHFEMVVMATIINTHMVAGLTFRLTDWCQYEYTSSTGNLPRKRRAITEQLLKAAFHTK